jgi:pimeloyl-ACP methyl ester carboxylesterase
MWANARNGSVKIGNTTMDYIAFGHGSKTLVMIPGLGDALKTVKGSAIPLAIMYRQYGRDCKVYIFSRKNKLEEGYSTIDMAKDQAEAMITLGIETAFVMGISQGGMIAQHLAAGYPWLVEKLVLAVTASRPNQTLQSVVGEWIAMAESEDCKNLIIDTAEKSYSEKHLQKLRFFYPVLCKFSKPKDYSRFLIQANACIRHNAYDALEKIKCPTLVIGGGSDRVVGADAAAETAARISGSKLFIYKDLGHMAFEEAKGFHDQVLGFLLAADA